MKTTPSTDVFSMLTRVVRRLAAYVRRRTSRLNGLNVSSRLAFVGLTAVLLCSTAFALNSAHTTTRASNIAAAEDLVDDSFQSARYEVGSEESLNRKYRLEPGKMVALEHRASADALVKYLKQASFLGDATDRAVVEDVLRSHQLYLIATGKMYAAVDRGDTRLALALDRNLVDPVFHRIEIAVAARAEVHSAYSDATLLQLRKAQVQSVTTTLFLSLLGLLSVGTFFVVMVTYQRRLNAIHKAKVKKLESAALIDDLTGIGNRRAYQEDFQREVSRAQRYGETLTLALLDVDDFKLINDRNGHMHGDSVLTKLAASLSSIRLEDRAYRIGGDEFALILPHTSIDTASETMQRLRGDAQANMIGCTVSVGLASLHGTECDVEALQAQADAAMYMGKRAGPDAITPFDASAEGMWLLSPSKIHSLHRLIASGSMPIAFQPIWDVRARRVLAYEALSRPDPMYGFNGPLEAFDLAERIGFAHELDTICRAAALTAAANLPSDALLFMNVSPQSLILDRLTPSDLVKAVRAAGLTPERVVIEITELSITRLDSVIESAQALQKHGFRLALDQTGAGSSGLEMLSRLPLDFVKIDREVIVKAIDDKGARGVLAGIIAIAEATGAYVIAEGIENIEMLKFVCKSQLRMRPAGRQHGIHGVQGFLLSPPSETLPKVNETIEVVALLATCAADGPPETDEAAILSAAG